MICRDLEEDERRIKRLAEIVNRPNLIVDKTARLVAVYDGVLDDRDRDMAAVELQATTLYNALSNETTIQIPRSAKMDFVVVFSLFVVVCGFGCIWMAAQVVLLMRN